MDKQLFFAVWDLPEMRRLIKTFMYPGKKTASYYSYQNGDIASYHGYLHLIKERSEWLRFTNHAMNWAAKNGHLNIVQWLHDNRREGCSVKAMNWAAKNGHLNIVQRLHDNRREGCSNLAMNLAAQNGHINVLDWLRNNRTEGCTEHAVLLAIKKGHLDVLIWLHNNQK